MFLQHQTREETVRCLFKEHIENVLRNKLTDSLWKLDEPRLAVSFRLCDCEAESPFAFDPISKFYTSPFSIGRYWFRVPVPIRNGWMKQLKMDLTTQLPIIFQNTIWQPEILQDLDGTVTVLLTMKK